MAITADDVSLEDIIPICLDFAVVEGELLNEKMRKISVPDNICVPQVNCNFSVPCNTFLLLHSF